MGEKLTGKSSGSIAAIQAPQWARRSELVEAEIPAMSVKEGDVYKQNWLVTFAVRFYMAEPPCVVVRVENMHKQVLVDIIRGSDLIKVLRLPEEPSTKPPGYSGHPEYGVPAEDIDPKDVEDDELDTVRPPGHTWVKSRSYRGAEDSWDEWLCETCNMHIRSRGDSIPSHGMCEGASTDRVKKTDL